MIFSAASQGARRRVRRFVACHPERRDQSILALAFSDVGTGQPQRLVDAGRQFGGDGACVGLTFREEITGMLVRELVELLLRTLNTEGGAVHAVLQVADLGGRLLLGLACPGDGLLILGGIAVCDGDAGLLHLDLDRFQLHREFAALDALTGSLLAQPVELGVCGPTLLRHRTPPEPPNVTHRL
jgi:hypothetical protein